MRVTVAKIDGRRYVITIERELGPPLVPRFAPGYDGFIPHDTARSITSRGRALEPRP